MTRPGLCGRCAHARTVESRRGSTFYLCGRSRTDPGFPRYPVLPVLRCVGFEADRDGGGNPDETEES
ncbi:MAG: hypothetical protein GWM90_31740 [Gemmatimonadetes bacterium]|nr:hypothetical protein [Gemmatimonadota bacterium]NIQ59819.1 hypothetical protein [Gemmatimonadota bacterium]NIU80022.1 hypothetical protein [Gammaproteobacteria bacterium]NIX48464.1 hypothetical protein [Gemmatimonadota bacterium]NIY12901.1 hypothetical protein [Gemmatimonadota bacterium]